MGEATPGSCARKGRVYARGKVGQIHEARLGRCARQGRADARGKAEHDTRQGRCKLKVRQLRESGQGRACARGKEGYMRGPR
jgi:hypothetical protein